MTVNVKVKDLEAARRACARLGWSLERRAHRWYGQWVDDSPVPRELFAGEAEYRRVLAMEPVDRKHHMTSLLNASEYAVKVPGCEYEMGLHRVGDHYAVSLDWWGDVSKFKEDNPFPQAYSLEGVKLLAERAGQSYTWAETKRADGSMVLEATDY